MKTVDLKGYRKKYASIKIVEMDLPKDIQAIVLLYQVYWIEKIFISFEDFYERYLEEKKEMIEAFRILSSTEPVLIVNINLLTTGFPAQR